jgi:hypothetical protein
LKNGWERARRTGRTKTYYVREAIVKHLGDLEDLYLAQAVRVTDPQRRTAHHIPEKNLKASWFGAFRKRDFRTAFATLLLSSRTIAARAV